MISVLHMEFTSSLRMSEAETGEAGAMGTADAALAIASTKMDRFIDEKPSIVVDWRSFDFTRVGS